MALKQVMVLMHVLLTQVDPGMDGALSTGAHTASIFHGLWENLCGEHSLVSILRTGGQQHIRIDTLAMAERYGDY